jgi:hypothetical protein
VLKVQQRWTDQLDTGAMSVLHFSYTGGPPSSANCATMAAAISTAAGNRFKSLMSAAAAVGTCTITDLTSATAGEGTGGPVTVGTRAGNVLAPGTAFVIYHEVARRYRGGKARTYLPIGVGGDISNGRWTAGIIASVTTAWQNFIADVLASGTGCTIAQFLSLSYYDAGARRATPRQDPVIGEAYNSLIGSQRRRNHHQ